MGPGQAEHRFEVLEHGLKSRRDKGDLSQLNGHAGLPAAVSGSGGKPDPGRDDWQARRAAMDRPGLPVA
jgi:hypothetical protein